MSSMGMGMGSLEENLWLSSFTMKMANMAMMDVTRVPTLVCGSFLQISMKVWKMQEGIGSGAKADSSLVVFFGGFS